VYPYAFRSLCPPLPLSLSPPLSPHPPFLYSSSPSYPSLSSKSYSVHTASLSTSASASPYNPLASI
jgi:hypothetical protein